MSVWPRRLVLEGRHPLGGVLLPDDARARAAVLALWRPGTVVHACGGGLLVRFEGGRCL